MKMWRCEICGYLHEGEEPPDFCPKCGATRDKFELLDEEETQMMCDAVSTKQKYVEIYAHLEEVAKLAREGAELDLDEGCNAVFKQVRENVELLSKKIQTELAGHAHECIWVKVAGDAEMP